MKSENIYNNLIAQADKIRRHNRQGSFETKSRYFEAVKRFCRFLAEEFHLEKLSNISDKHLHAYVAHMRGKESSTSTIMTDLSAIRFYHDKLPNPRYTLLSNRELQVGRRSTGDSDRTWSDSEFERMVQVARQEERNDYATILHIARYAGLRIHECFRIDTATARNAVNSMTITIKGKGGKTREVPVPQSVCDMLSDILAATKPGHKLFVPDGMSTKTAIKSLQHFIETHREEPVTFHGLRHSYAAETYLKLLADGCTEREAARKLSQLLGHERTDIARTYLASIKKKPGDV